MRFTADDAFACAEAGEPIMIDLKAARAIFAQHDTGEPWDAFTDEHPGEWSGVGSEAVRHWDAAELLGWLGY